jgi:hypothetical protein
VYLQACCRFGISNALHHTSTRNSSTIRARSSGRCTTTSTEPSDVHAQSSSVEDVKQSAMPLSELTRLLSKSSCCGLARGEHNSLRFRIQFCVLASTCAGEHTWVSYRAVVKHTLYGRFPGPYCFFCSSSNTKLCVPIFRACSPHATATRVCTCWDASSRVNLYGQDLLSDVFMRCYPDSQLLR